MQGKKSLNPDNIWFVCDKCGTSYDDHMEEIIPPGEIKGSIEWAYSPTSHENRWDALTKLRIREQYENKKRKSKRKELAESSKR
tara:strand:+ start:3778 stop:4029 length:252 start_codon:yes stop_codon:yes gene_type:complete